MMSQQQLLQEFLVVGPPVSAVLDITKVFVTACQELGAAQLVKDKNFTLFESVGALEIMDPKMDSGYLAPGDALEEDYDISRELLPEEVVGIMDQLLCYEAAWHMGHSLSQTLFTSIYLDRLLWPVPHNLEAAKFNRPARGRQSKQQCGVGTPPVSSCAGPLPTLVSLVLRAYCLCLVKAAGKVHDRITRELYFEEEDFVSQTYNRNLLSEIETGDIIVVVDEALSWLDSQDKGPEYTKSLAPGNPQTSALKARLIFRREFLMALEGDFSMIKHRDASSFKAAREQLDVIRQFVFQKSVKGVICVSKPVPEAFSTKTQRHLATSIPPKPIVDTISLETAIPFLSQLCTDAVDILELVENYEGPHCLLTAVNVFTSRRRPGHTHGIAQLGRESSCYVRCLAQAFLLHPTQNPSDEVQRRIQRPQMLSRRDSGAPIQSDESTIQILDGISLKSFICQSLSELVLPHSRNNFMGPETIGALDPENESVEAPFDNRFKVSKIMSEVIARFGPVFVDLYRSLCLNRCRVRRNMTHTIIDWDVIQSEAETFDIQLIEATNERGLYLEAGSMEPTFAYPLSSWVYHHKLRQIRHTIQMGFELEIYAVEEISGMYYYLSHVCANHLAHIDRIRVCLIGTERYREAGRSSYAGVADSAGIKDSISLAYARTYALLDRLSTELIATDAFAIAMHSLISLLNRYGLLEASMSVPSRKVGVTTRRKHYSRANLKYDLRMKPFLPLGLPEVVPFEKFERAACLEGQSDEAVLERATRAIAEAKKGYERNIAVGMHSGSDKSSSSILGSYWMVDAKDTLRACISGSLAITQLSKVMRPEPATNQKHRETLPLEATVPAVGERGRWHPWWPVPRLMPVTRKPDSPPP